LGRFSFTQWPYAIVEGLKLRGECSFRFSCLADALPTPRPNAIGS
jgi:hypothetical protein